MFSRLEYLDALKSILDNKCVFKPILSFGTDFVYLFVTLRISLKRARDPPGIVFVEEQADGDNP